MLSKVSFSTSARFSNHPVVPHTTGTLFLINVVMLLKALSGRVNSIATSTCSSVVVNKSPALCASIITGTVFPLSNAIFSMVLPIFPYPIIAILAICYLKLTVKDRPIELETEAVGINVGSKLMIYCSPTLKFIKCASTAASIMFTEYKSKA